MGEGGTGASDGTNQLRYPSGASFMLRARYAHVTGTTRDRGVRFARIRTEPTPFECGTESRCAKCKSF